MLPVFSNPVGLYALLGIPVVLVIHFLQQRSKPFNTSVYFLIEALAPESRTGRIWDRIRNSLTLWMQILFILLLAWVIAKPRWLQADTRQTVAFVMDDSLRMRAFKTEALATVSDDIAAIRAGGIPTHWLLMTTSSRKAPLYRGDDPDALMETLSRWEPNEGEHDPEPALRTAGRTVAGRGVSRLITMSRSRAPAWQSAVGVGRPIDNAGFVGLIPEGLDGRDTWRLAIRNYSSRPQTREVECVTDKGSVRQTATLNPHALSEIKIAMPPGVDRMEVRLQPDQFTLDDRIPLVRDTPRQLPVSVPNDEGSAFFRAIVSTVKGSRPANQSDPVRVRILAINDPSQIPQGPAIVSAADAPHTLPPAIITAEDHALTRDLAWGGLLIPARGGLDNSAPRQTLLWSGGHPIAWLQQQTLVFNWKWVDSNADRIPATALLIRRYLQTIQGGMDGYWSGNLATGVYLPVKGAGQIQHAPLDGPPVKSRYNGILPDTSGWATITASDDETVLCRIGLYPPDARQGDFSECSSFEHGGLDQRRVLEEISSPDPLTPLWLSLAGAALLASWLPVRKARRAGA